MKVVYIGFNYLIWGFGFNLEGKGVFAHELYAFAEMAVLIRNYFYYKKEEEEKRVSII